MSFIPESYQQDEAAERFNEMLDRFVNIQCRYQSAIREVRTKLEILDEEFQMRDKRNPIHHMQSRMKTFTSIIEKLKRKDLPITLETAMSELTDIAGIRVICSYIADIYAIADLLMAQDDIKVLRIRDYIKTPKANGYRSLHLIVEVPVYLSKGKILVPVEIQIRTIAMDLWASLEHELRYKEQHTIPKEISEQLFQSAEDIAQIDCKMQTIYNVVSHLTD